MAGELQASYRPGRACYFLVRSATGTIWNGTSFETYSTGSYSSYGISAAEQGTSSAYYTGTFPSSASPGVYSVVMKEQLGGSPAEADPVVAMGEFNWNGSRTAALCDTATSGQLGLVMPIQIARGHMKRNFGIYLKSAADHITPFTSGVVSGSIARDGSSFGPLQSGAFTEQGMGWYNLQALTSGDLNAEIVKLMFTANGISGGRSDPLPIQFVLQRTSGG